MSGAQAEYTFRLARTQDIPAIIRFMNLHWGSRHPLVNLPDFFNYYYLGADGRVNFALAEQNGNVAALAGFIPSNIKIKPDIWVSLWVADKTANGSGLALMAELPRLTGCRVLACNNIRPQTRPFYEFLGYTTGKLRHFYRLAQQNTYRVATVTHTPKPSVSGQGVLVAYTTFEDVVRSGFIPYENAVPYKDFWYIQRRYFAYPQQSYQVYGLLMPGEKHACALLAARVIPVNGTAVLRIVDFIGNPLLIAETGTAIAALMGTYRVEYADWYCAGVDTSLLHSAGFTERAEGDTNIIPHYLTPPLYENNDFYYFTSQPAHFTMFKADGDQDRPNIQLPEK